MEIDGNIEFLGPFEEGPISRVIVEMALVVIVDQGPDETELLHTAGELVCSCSRIRDGDRRPTSKP